MLRYCYPFLWFVIVSLVYSCCPGTPENELQKEEVDSNNSEVRDMIGYIDFLVRMEKVGTGSKKDNVKILLGEPDSRSDSTWTYDLTNRKGFPGIPPPPGTTVFSSIVIVFKNDSVKDVSKTWMDVDGPKPGF